MERKNFGKYITILMMLLLLGLYGVTASAFTARLSAPSTSDARYYSGSNPYYYATAYGAKNCTNYVYGRAWEILGSKPNLVFGGNAGNWFVLNRQEGRYPYGSTPQLGAIACWRKAGDTIGHVAVVEQISGNTLTLSEAWYKQKDFNTFTRDASNMYYKSPTYGEYYFQGYIYLTPQSTNPDDYSVPTRALYYVSSNVMTGSDVYWLQCVLRYLGYTIDIDGSYGPACKSVVAKFQADYGLTADGSCGPATLAKLKEVYNAKKNPTPSHETTPPTISDVWIVGTPANNIGFSVRCKAADASGIDRVQFAVWTEKNGQDDLADKWSTSTACSGKKSGDEYVFWVSDAEHNYERGLYHIHIYAYDKYGNHTLYEEKYDFTNAFKTMITGNYQGHQYYLFEDILDYEDAKKKCEEMGGHLATITSAGEQAAITAMTKKGNREIGYIVGGERSGSSFKWITGEKFTYENWAAGEPNNVNEKYITVYQNGTWNDSSDNDKKGFILEVDPVSQSGTNNSTSTGSTVNTAKTYKVTLNPNQGTVATTSKTVTYGKTYGTLATPTRKGYKFNGWYTAKTGGTKITSATTVNLTKNQTLYAQWSKITVKKATVKKVQNVSGKKLKVTVKALSGVSGYEICYGTNSKVTKGVKKTTTTGSSVIFSNLKKKKTYYVKVRAYTLDSAGQKVYGAYSSVKKIKINK